MEIRFANPGDYTGVAHLFRAIMGDNFTLDEPLWARICADGENSRTHCALVAVQAGQVLGVAVVVISDRIQLTAGTQRKRFHLDQLIVAPEARRQGIGRALLDRVVALAAAVPPSYIIVNCDFMNVAARRTYESAGLHLVRQSSDRFEVAFP